MVNYTSIQIMPKTRKQLATLKASPRDTYDEVIQKLMALIPKRDDEGDYKDEFRISLLNARLELKAGNTISLKDAKFTLGLK